MLARSLTLTAAAIVLCPSVAFADPHDHRWHGGPRYFHHGYYPRYYSYHPRYYSYSPYWREGRWYHGSHGDRFGWWWIAAGTWYFYPAPVYPYPDPYPPVVIEPAPVAEAQPRESVWYYCESSRNYYPYVRVCPEGWRTVSAEPDDADERDDQ